MFERTGRAVKHIAVCGLLTHGDKTLGPDLTRFLGDAYEMKSEAAEAIETAREFVETIAAILGPEAPNAPPPDPAHPPRTERMPNPLPLIS